jgi:hypothetical protein
MIALTRQTTGQAVVEAVLKGNAPAGMWYPGRLDLNGTDVTELPAGFRCYQLELRNTPIRALPDDLQVDCKLDLQDCKELTALPENLKVGTLILRGCTALEVLPEGLDVCFLDLRGCTRLPCWPRRLNLRIGRLNASGCTQLTELPRGLGPLSQLDVSNCSNLAKLPDGLRVSSWIDLGGTKVTRLPASARGTPLRWKGVPIDERIAFRPESITADEILVERNAELRRVLLERVGFERFMTEARAKVLDEDHDAGGPRQLLCVPIEGDEDLVCVSVYCPSTGRRYLLRVPPGVRTCHEAIAWTAGFDDPDDYNPQVET